MDIIGRIKGSTIAIVYIFEGETAPGFNHYHIWQGDIIAGWLEAVQALHCRPFILDVRTFVEKGLSNTLPHIDYVLNLNCGSEELSPMGLVPSTCAFLGIPCIPCDASTVVVGENKKMSNILAEYVGLTVPSTLEQDNIDGLFRPLNFGSSLGVVKGFRPNNTLKGVYQEFIYGVDITTPYVFNPLLNAFSSLPTILYLPDSRDLSWFFGESAKLSKTGYQRKIIHGITPKLDHLYKSLIKELDIRTFCRIDARIRCDNYAAAEHLLDSPLNQKNLYFIEINTMPTVSESNSFGFSFASINSQDEILPYVQIVTEFCDKLSPQGFALVSSIISFIITRY